MKFNIPKTHGFYFNTKFLKFCERAIMYAGCRFRNDPYLICTPQRK